MSIMSRFSFPYSPTLEFHTAHVILQSCRLPNPLELLQWFVRASRAAGQPEKRALTSRHGTGHYRRKMKKIKGKKHEKFEKRTMM
jgi:hypothetical protein